MKLLRKTVFGIMLALLLSSMLVLAFTIRSASAATLIYIKTDGAVDPPSAPISTSDNITYTLTDNIIGYVHIQRSNIVVDGKGYTVQAGGANFGIHASASNVTVKNMTITQSSYGIWVHGNYFVGSENNITGNGNYGIFLEGSQYSTLVGNNITANGGGILLKPYGYPPVYNNISGNYIAQNPGTGLLGDGIRLETASYNNMSGNYITANGDDGILLMDDSYGNKVYANDLVMNGVVNIHILNAPNYPQSNYIFHNSFVNSTGVQAIRDSGSGFDYFDDGYPSGGNYWSDYKGVDANGDGIGDAQYPVPGDSSDRYPLMNPYRAHDLAVTNVSSSKTVVCQGYSAKVNVTVANQGKFEEEANIMIYADSETALNKTGLAGYWSFDEGWGTIAVDHSGNSNYGYFMPQAAWEWQKLGDLEGWIATQQVTEFGCDGTSLNGKTTGGDPFIHSPSGLAIDAFKAKTVHLKMKASVISQAQIFFITNADPNWDEPKSQLFDLAYAGQWVEYVMDFSDVPGWTGTITQIRLDPGTLTGVDFNVDWFRVGSSPHWKPGKFGSALLFTSIDDQVSAPFIPLNSRSFTVTAWFNARNLPSYPVDAPLLGQLETPTADRFLHLALRNGIPYFGFYDDDLGGTTTVNPNTWYHIAFVYNLTNNYKYIYLNGALDATGLSSSPYMGAAGNTTIGSYSGSFFNGKIDEVRIYDRALTQQEIEALVSSGAFQTKSVILSSLGSTTLGFTWNTTGWAKGNYSLSAVAQILSGEFNVTDNKLSDGWVYVSMVGDLTGKTANPWDFVPDGMVDGSDLIVVSRCFGSWPTAPSPMRWHPNCDITDDNVIDGSDLIIVSRHYGEQDP